MLRAAVAVLVRGGIVAYPTDTLYGLAVDPRRHTAVHQLCTLKGRVDGAGLPLIAESLGQVERCLGAMSPLAHRLAQQFWPGPLTLVIEAGSTLAPGVHAGDGSLAVRVPRIELARRLAGGLEHPITATSANRAGETPGATARDVATALGAQLGLVLDVGTPMTGAPSTIVDTREDPPRLLRDGALPWDHVLQSLA